MKKLTPLIHADPERSAYGEIYLVGTVSGYTARQIRAGHESVTPVLSPDGSLTCLEIVPHASALDICAVLHSCGIPIQGIAGDFTFDRLGRSIRYSVEPCPDIGEDIFSLVPLPNQDIID